MARRRRDGLDDGLIGAHLSNSASGKRVSIGENMDAVGEVHHQQHVALDQHDRHAVGDDAADDGGWLGVLDRIAAEHRFA